MGTKKNIKGINFKRNPYRGIFRELAEELYPDKSPEDQMVVRIFRKYKKGNPEITKKVIEKCNEREALYMELRKRKPIYDKVDA